ncbi:glycosyltransferase [Fundidesulfovibrio agrisoli]|uniref:glycosyltransferase n=1 Tax=Fundidesulfovibrio agrisoli TaxID=2922717 RepID=UPI001FADB492|nr:glycosyltransferase [Fundidesulfovibrio agrisoli]
MKTALFTICCANYLPRAAVLLESLAANGAVNGAANGVAEGLHLVLAEDPASIPALGPDFAPPAGAGLMTIDELGLPDARGMAFQYNVTEFNTALKPWAMLRLLDMGYDAAVYLDPDIRFYSGLEPLLSPLERADLLLTPHIAKPCDCDGVFPTVRDCLHAGQFNLGFMALRRSQQTLDFLRWWSGRLREHCLQEPGYAYFVDQLWASQAPSFVDKVEVLRGPGLNAAYWNLFQRELARTGDGWTADGESLTFFHFSGYDPARPERLSRYSAKGSPVQPGTPLAELLEGYREALAEAGERYRFAARPYSFGAYTDGEPVTQEDRRRYLALPKPARERAGDPFEGRWRRPEAPLATGRPSPGLTPGPGPAPGPGLCPETSAAPARLAFLLMGGEGWFAGLVHIRNLVRALKLADPKAQAHILALPGSGPLERARLEAFLDAPLLPCATPGEVRAALARGGYDALFAAERPFLHGELPVPWLAFLHDFQHFRLPEHFPPQEAAARRASFQRAAMLADGLAVSGRDALADCAAFLPGEVRKAHVLPPAPWPGPEVQALCEAPWRAALRLGLPRRYLLLPAQMWSHKNHLTALEALARRPEPDMALVLTGAPLDGRAPAHARLLRERMAPLEREGRVFVTGLLPPDDALQLMRGAEAVVLPSLFEGYGLAVAEAQALGKPLLLSDIAAHREHGATTARFFEPTDAQALSELMREAWATPGADHDPAREREALALARERAREAGEALLRAVTACKAASASRVRPSGDDFAARGLLADAAVALTGDQSKNRSQLLAGSAPEAGAMDGRALAQALRAGLAASVRHAFLMGEAEAGRILARALLQRGPGGDAEGFYWAGLEALRQGAPIGLEILERVRAGGNGVTPGLRAWACFKLGEALQSSDGSAARSLFEEALAHDPGLAKARLALLPPDRLPLLAVNLPAPGPEWVRADFDPMDESLWAYYLGTGEAGGLLLALQDGLPPHKGRELAALLAANLAPGASARLRPGREGLPPGLAQALLEQGASLSLAGHELTVTFPHTGDVRHP